MKHHMIKGIFLALLAAVFVAQADANPWWSWPVKSTNKAPVKTVQLSLPATNGGMISVTVPLKGKTVKAAAGHVRAQDSRANRLDDERLAADIESHF
jgi:hypothetical protein